MSKFRMKLKLQGLEFEIEGTREDASVLGRNVGQHLANLVQPLGKIIEGEVGDNSVTALGNVISLPPARKPRRRRSNAGSSDSSEAEGAINFRHDPAKFGTPKQDWKTADKAIWLLYVLKESANTGEFPSLVLVETFNKHFRQAGTITSSNVSRDLGRLKVKEKPAPVGEDTTKNPPAWYLTEHGNARAQTLVTAALGQ